MSRQAPYHTTPQECGNITVSACCTMSYRAETQKVSHFSWLFGVRSGRTVCLQVESFSLLCLWLRGDLPVCMLGAALYWGVAAWPVVIILCRFECLVALSK